MNAQKLLPLLALTATLLVAACSKITAAHYAKLEAGMSQDEVHAILGAPSETSGSSVGGLSLSSETWKGAKETITVTYAGDKVALKNIAPNK